MWLEQGDYATARHLFETSLEIRRELGDLDGIAASLISFGEVAWRQGDYATFRSLQQENLTIRRELGDRHGIAVSLVHQARVACTQGDYASAYFLEEASLRYSGSWEIVRESRMVATIWRRWPGSGVTTLPPVLYRRRVWSISGVGRSSRHRECSPQSGVGGLYSRRLRFRSFSLSRRICELFKELGERPGIALSFHSLGNLASDQGNYASAQSL